MVKCYMSENEQEDLFDLDDGTEDDILEEIEPTEEDDDEE